MDDAPMLLDSPTRLLELVGQRVGVSQWHMVDQELVNTFGRITKDEQWIHVDEAAAAAGPFGGTIAHGYLTLSLCSVMLGEALTVEGANMVINYGLDRVRYPAPAQVGRRIRAQVSLKSASEVDSGIQAVYHMVVERDGDAETKPACVADVVFRYVTG